MINMLNYYAYNQKIKWLELLVESVQVIFKLTGVEEIKSDAYFFTVLLQLNHVGLSYLIGCKKYFEQFHFHKIGQKIG